MAKREPLYPHVPKSRKVVEPVEIPITQQEIAELVNLYHTAQTAVGHRRYDRLVWAADQFHRTHPSISASKAYKLVDESTRP